MRLVASDPARELIVERSGRLYVDIRTEYCCRGARRTRTLLATTAPTHACEWQRIASDDAFDVYMPRDVSRVPAELHVEVRRFPRRIEAYWNGNPWID